MGEQMSTNLKILSPAMQDEIVMLINSIVDERLANNQAEPYLTVKEAAKLSGFQEQTIRKKISQGEIPVYRNNGGRGVRVRLSDFMKQG